MMNCEDLMTKIFCQIEGFKTDTHVYRSEIVNYNIFLSVEHMINGPIAINETKL